MPRLLIRYRGIYIHDGAGDLHDPEDKHCHSGNQDAQRADLFFADFSGQLGGHGGHQDHDDCAAKAGDGHQAGVVEVILVQEGVQRLGAQAGHQGQQRHHDDGQQGTAGDQVLQGLAHAKLFLAGGGLGRVDLDALDGQLVAAQVEDGGADAENDAGDGKPLGDDHLLARLIAGKHQDGGDDADHHAGQGGADGAPGGQLGALLGVVGDDGGHAAIGDVEHDQPHDPEGLGEIAHPVLVDEHTAQAHRDGRPFDPGAEAPFRGGLGGVADAAHAEVGEGVHDFTRGGDGADDGAGQAQHIGAEGQQPHTGEQEGEIVAKVTHGIADLVSQAKRPCCLICAHRSNPSFCLICRWSAFHRYLSNYRGIFNYMVEIKPRTVEIFRRF